MTTMDSDSESQDSDEGRRFRFEATRKDSNSGLNSRRRKSVSSPLRREEKSLKSRSRDNWEKNPDRRDDSSRSRENSRSKSHREDFRYSRNNEKTTTNHRKSHENSTKRSHSDDKIFSRDKREKFRDDKSRRSRGREKFKNTRNNDFFETVRDEETRKSEILTKNRDENDAKMRKNTIERNDLRLSDFDIVSDTEEYSSDNSPAPLKNDFEKSLSTDYRRIDENNDWKRRKISKNHNDRLSKRRAVKKFGNVEEKNMKKFENLNETLINESATLTRVSSLSSLSSSSKKSLSEMEETSKRKKSYEASEEKSKKEIFDSSPRENLRIFDVSASSSSKKSLNEMEEISKRKKSREVSEEKLKKQIFDSASQENLRIFDVSASSSSKKSLNEMEETSKRKKSCKASEETSKKQIFDSASRENLQIFDVSASSSSKKSLNEMEETLKRKKSCEASEETSKKKISPKKISTSRSEDSSNFISEDTNLKISSPEGTEKNLRFVGPNLPDGFLGESANVENEATDEIFGPVLPPHLSAPNDLGLGQRIIFPERRSAEEEKISSDDEYCVGPLPADHPALETDVVQRQLERRALRLKVELAACDNEDEKKREEWMIELPSVKSSSLGLEARKFRIRPGPDMSDRSSWTDTPIDRARKRAEMLENKNVEAPTLITHTEPSNNEKSRKREKSLLEIHQKKLHKKKKKEEKEAKKIGKTTTRRPFDRDIDLQANRFDQSRQKNLLLKARELDDRFSRGKI